MINNFLNNIPTYDSYQNIIKHIKNNYYNFIKVSSIGSTILSRSIYSFSIGNLDNPTLFIGTVHSQEWLTGLLLIKFIYEILDVYKKNIFFHNFNISYELKSNGIIIVPIVNPDGLEIAVNGPDSSKHLSKSVKEIMKKSDKTWQANARGVDLNHNFDAGFKLSREIETQNNINGYMPRQFGGFTPNSENETKALINLCSKYNFKRVLAFHSQGEEIYYKYGKHTPYSSNIIANILKEYSGYQLIENSGLASHAGFKDWFIEKCCKPGFTIEIGKGKNPLPIEQLNEIYIKIIKMMVISFIL